MDKLVYLGFAVLELSILIMYETYYDKLQSDFGHENVQLHFMNNHSFILSVNKKNITKISKNLEDLFDFSNLNANHELLSSKNRKVTDKFKIETPDDIWVDEFIFLRSKMYAYRCGSDGNIKLKYISKSYLKKILNLMNIKIVWMEKIIKKNVMNVLFDHLIMKYTFNE